MAGRQDSPSQDDVSQSVIETVRTFLGGPRLDGDRYIFDFGEHLESNWGSVYGGALAAGALAVARAVAPERSPRSLHLQIVRSVPRGGAFATANIRHSGRTVGTIEVELFDQRRKLAMIGLVTMVVPDAVASAYHATSAEPFQIRSIPIDATHALPAPIVRTLDMLRELDGVPAIQKVDNVRPSVDGTAACGLQMTVPWEGLDHTGPEAACLAADAIIAAPIMESFVPLEVLGPNADLTLRFTTAPATPIITASGAMLSLQHGTATVAIEVHAATDQLAHGLATSVLQQRS
jgi:acyl-coenzyme A thioesterase PaaI-like protein